MALNIMMDWQGDPLTADALPANCYLLMATSKYGGTYRQIIAPASPNYPAGTPTRYVAYLPGFPFVDGGHAITVYDSTAGTSLTAVNTAPGVNQYYNPIKGAGTNYPTNTTKEPDFIEFNSGQAGHTIDFTFYAIGSVLHAANNDVAVKTITVSENMIGSVLGNLVSSAALLNPIKFVYDSGSGIYFCQASISKVGSGSDLSAQATVFDTGGALGGFTLKTFTIKILMNGTTNYATPNSADSSLVIATARSDAAGAITILNNSQIFQYSTSGGVGTAYITAYTEPNGNKIDVKISNSGSFTSKVLVIVEIIVSSI